MKELSIEEKAKAYDEAIERAKSLLSSKLGNAWIYKLLPELAELEDKRIRQLLISFVKYDMPDNYSDDFSKEDCLAWLEKQGEKTKPIEDFDTEFEKQVSCLIAGSINKDYEYTKAFVKWAANGLLEYAKHEIKKQGNMGISEATKQKLEDNLNKALEKETPESWNKFLDEQGEQKPTIEMKSAEESLGIDSDTYNEIVDECIYGEQKSQRMISAEAKEAMYDKPAWSEEDEKEVAVLEAYIRSRDWSERHIDRALGIVDELVNKVKSLRPQPSQEWSEEDENVIQVLKNIVKHSDEIDENIYTMTLKEKLYDFLKSLKNRVLLQPKQEWSEEDEVAVKDICDKLNRLSMTYVGNESIVCQEDIKWLKSIKERVQPQSKWKLSDEQIKALDIAIQCGIQLGTWEEDVLKSLAEQLKKLREK